VDLVKIQIDIANGKELPFKQEDLKQIGHAIEVRIYAEDPDNNFMPSPGTIRHITEPLGLGVRHDGYVYAGYEIPIYYDPMISKLIVWAPTRREAIDRMRRALHAYKITGIKTSIPFLNRIMEVPAFVEGKYNTHFIQDHEELLKPHTHASRRLKDVAAMTAFFDYLSKIETVKKNTFCKRPASNWKNTGRRNNLNRS